MAFQPGKSGNPGGGPKEAPKLRDAARAHTEAALQVIVASLGDDDAKVRLKAAEIILDRGYGKPAQSVTVGGDADNPVSTINEVRWTVVKS